MKAVDPQVTLKEAEFQSPIAECYDMYFTGVNGARIYVRHLRPKNIKGKIPAVLQFHGYSGNCGDWSDKLGYVASGVAVFAMDVRGQGGKSEDVGGVCGNTLHGHIIRGLHEKDPKKLLYRDVFLDTAELAGIAMNMECIDETKVYATGGSQGGALTLACAALEPRVAKLVHDLDYLLIVNDNSNVSVYSSMLNMNTVVLPIAVREIKNGKTREFYAEDMPFYAYGNYMIPLYVGRNSK